MDIGYTDNRRPQPTTKQRVDRDDENFYPTPSWATHALLQHERFEGPIEDPACGDGAMAEVLRGTGLPVAAYDLYDRGYGEPGHDFLLSKRRVANIVTNPPYDFAEGFVRKGLELAENKLAMLLRLALLEGANRARTIYARTPPSRVWVFSQRITFYPKGIQTAGSGTTAYAWFVWDKHDASGVTRLGWFPPTYKPKAPRKPKAPAEASLTPA